MNETMKKAIEENDVVQVNPKALAERGVGSADGMTTWRVVRLYKNGTANLVRTESVVAAGTIGPTMAQWNTIEKIEMRWLRLAETPEQREARRADDVEHALEYATREIAAAIQKPAKDRDTLINELVAARDKGPGEVAYWMEWKSYHLAVASAKALLATRYYKEPVDAWLANPTAGGLENLAMTVADIEPEILKAEILQTISDGQSTSKSDSIATDAKLVAAKELLDGGTTSSIRWAVRGALSCVKSANAAW